MESRSRFKPEELLEGYDLRSLSIASIASHSALDIFDGAKDEGFRTVAVCEVGREKAYSRFDRIVDIPIVLERFSKVIEPEVVKRLRELNTVFIPNRSFSVYVGYDAIENIFNIPIFGNRYLLRYEERAGEKNYYKLLDEARINRPRIFNRPDEVDRPVIVKLPHARKRVERGFFIAADRDDLARKARELASRGMIRLEDIPKASIEELVLGAHFNINYFRSIARDRVEILSIDRRIQSNLDGFLRLPASVQLEIGEYVDIEMIEVGHEAATIRESLLEKLFDVGDRFVEACRKLEPPGVIGPFTLQLIVTKDLDLIVFDVALRIGGGTNIYMGIGSQYSKLYFGRPISMGRRIAMEIRECAETGCIKEVVT